VFVSFLSAFNDYFSSDFGDLLAGLESFFSSGLCFLAASYSSSSSSSYSSSSSLSSSAFFLSALVGFFF